MCWKSSRQNLVTTSSTEAEIVSINEAVKESIWLYKFASELGLVENKPIPIFCDNQSAIRLANQVRSIQRTKHLRARFGFLQEQPNLKTESLLQLTSNQNRN